MPTIGKPDACEAHSKPRLSGRRAIITGAVGGQGRAVALRFVAEGAQVVVTDLPSDELTQLEKELGQGGTALAVPADAGREDHVQAVVAAAVEAFGGLDILYNNAAVRFAGRDAPVDRLDVGIWDETMAVNARGVFLFCKHAVPHLLESGDGVILNVSSVAGYKGDVECHAYAASKGALIGLTMSIAQRWGRDGLRAIVVAPGFIDTPMVERFVKNDAALQGVLASTALGRVGRPEEIAAAAVFLASKEASFLTSVIVPVHGGLVK